VAPKKALPEPTIAEIVDEEEDGTFVRPRPIRGRTGNQRYPAGAAAAGESGRATVKICITARGMIENVVIVESTGFERLDNDALDVARQYRFRPAPRNGKAIPVCMPYSINYRIH
jgi:protein TonB